MTIRRANERGHFQNDWLNTYYTFSFAEYFDPKHMGFHDLRVINDDIVAAEGGFPTHGHRDMEIISYIVDGAIAHKDSMGNVETLQAGEVQVMSAGQGVLHSEFNPNQDKELRLLQIWIKPDRPGLAPGYAQRVFSREEKLNRLCLLASPTGEDHSLQIHQDARIYASILTGTLDMKVGADRAVWLQVVNGLVTATPPGGPVQDLGRGDSLAIETAGPLKLTAKGEAEFLVFDLIRRPSTADIH